MDQRRSTLRAGLTAGLIGYAAVAVFYAMFDLLAARGALFTLDLLGKAVFRGARDPAALQLPMTLDVWAMVAYNFLHLGVALAVGLFVAWLVSRVDGWPTITAAIPAVLLIGYLLTIATIGWLAQDIRPLLPWWTVVVANTLAALLAGAYLLRAYPELWGRLTHAS